MDENLVTFVVFPGPHGKVHKIRLPLYAVYLVGVFSLVGIITVVALANSYTRMLLKVSNYDRMRSEREALKTQYRTLENAANQTNAKLFSLETLASDVALSYGLGQASRPRFPRDVLNVATLKNLSLESSYHASLNALSFMNRAATEPTFQTAGFGTLSGAQIDRSVIPSIWPVQGQVTAGFGQRLDPLSGEGAFHSGIDIAAPMGSRVDAPADGIVFFAGPEAGYGNTILIDHGYGIKTKYGHLSKISVVVGQEVKRGEVIGAVGMTGKTTGPHLHYEVHVHETPVTPARYLH